MLGPQTESLKSGDKLPEVGAPTALAVQPAPLVQQQYADQALLHLYLIVHTFLDLDVVLLRYYALEREHHQPPHSLVQVLVQAVQSGNQGQHLCDQLELLDF